jgi:hypothetical protein
VVAAPPQQPIQGATVYTYSGSTTTDASGNFRLSDVTVGSYNSPTKVDVTASATGYYTAEKTVTIFCGATIVLDFGRPTTAFGEIEGTVTNSTTGLPISGAFVGSEFGASTTTSAQGYYKLTQAPLGASDADRVWKITAAPTGFNSQTQPVTVSANQTVRLDFQFVQPTATPTATLAPSATATSTPTLAPSPTATATSTPTGTPTPTATPTSTGTPVPSSTPTATSAATATATPTQTATVTATPTITPTSMTTVPGSATAAPSPTSTPSPAALTATATWTPTPGATTSTPMSGSSDEGSEEGGSYNPPSEVAPAATPTSTPAAVQVTGFRVADIFMDYYLKRGGVGTFGYPVSRLFILQGRPVQVMQGAVFQLTPWGGVARLNLLDGGYMPYDQINFSPLPPEDPDMILSAPQVGEEGYAERAMEFVRAHAPDQWNGMPVNFLQTFLSTIRYEDAYPEGTGYPELMPLMNLEIWGMPTSKPLVDPNNSNFVYQRFQRGVMHFDASAGHTTRRLLLGDYFKGVMTGQNLPDDLDLAARGSCFYGQYDRSRPLHLDRPEELTETDLTEAFEPELLETRVASVLWWEPWPQIAATVAAILVPAIRVRRRDRREQLQLGAGQ